MATDTNIRVINNEEHEGIFRHGDGLIMSDDLLERMGVPADNEVVSATPQDESELSIESRGGFLMLRLLDIYIRFNSQIL